MELDFFRDSSCTKCELHEGIKSVCIPTIWYPGSQRLLDELRNIILFIGQNPGHWEDQKDEPFIGKSGELVKKVYVGGCSLQHKASVYLANGVRCHTQSNETPKQRHYKECSNFLTLDMQKFRLLNPDKFIVVTLGAPATTSFYANHVPSLIPKGKKKVSLTDSFSLNGGFHEGWGCYVFSTYHPAAVLRNNNYINAVESHMQLVSDCLDGTMAEPSDPLIVPTRSPRR
jgi:uracil-DNA glycosylase family 4